jgi:hypothetical protein
LLGRRRAIVVLFLIHDVCIKKNEKGNQGKTCAFIVFDLKWAFYPGKLFLTFA